MSVQNRTSILGLGVAIPEKILTNKDLEKMVETSDEWIESRTGIRERRILGENEELTDLAFKASQEAIERAGLTAKDIDLVIGATWTPERLAPTIASKTTELLGIPTIPAFDLNAACSGFIYGMSVADAMRKSAGYKNVLIIAAEAQSRYLDFTDRKTCILFGDGAAATVVGDSTRDNQGMFSCMLGADSTGSELITLNYDRIIGMDGPAVFKFAVKTMGDALEECLKLADMPTSAVDMLVPHQANTRIIDAAAKRISIDNDKVVRCIDRYGNTAAVSIPLSLYEAQNEGRLKPGMTLALVGFGAGFTYGSAIVKW